MNSEMSSYKYLKMIDKEMDISISFYSTFSISPRLTYHKYPSHTV